MIRILAIAAVVLAVAGPLDAQTQRTGAQPTTFQKNPNARPGRFKRPECLRRAKTEKDCLRRCPGDPVGDCMRRVRAAGKGGPK